MQESNFLRNAVLCFACVKQKINSYKMAFMYQEHRFICRLK